MEPAYRERHVGAGGCEASAPRETRRCRFFTCTNATGGKPRRVCASRTQVEKPAATGGGAGVTPAHRGKPVGAGFFPALTLRVGNQDVCASKAQVGKPAATGTEQKHACSRLPAPNSSSRNASLPRLEWRFSGVNAESLRVRPPRVIRCKHPWRVSRRHAMPVLGVAMNSRSRP